MWIISQIYRARHEISVYFVTENSQYFTSVTLEVCKIFFVFIRLEETSPIQFRRVVSKYDKCSRWWIWKLVMLRYGLTASCDCTYSIAESLTCMRESWLVNRERGAGHVLQPHVVQHLTRNYCNSSSYASLSPNLEPCMERIWSLTNIFQFILSTK